MRMSPLASGGGRSLPSAFSASFPTVSATSFGSLGPVTLILGGVRSGKSRFAETLIEQAGGGTYLATAEPGDAEMESRIARHRARRGADWETCEEPLDLVGAIEARTDERPVLVDCLTLWLSNLMHRGADIERESARLAGALPFASPVVFVSNEVGLGIVPENALARAFRDHAGRLHQLIAARADTVVFMAAGLPMFLKQSAGKI
jgi:adenosylcobinamide kinase / adenosylcobinamide-phosphate guanylyltransferase